MGTVVETDSGTSEWVLFPEELVGLAGFVGGCC